MEVSVVEEVFVRVANVVHLHVGGQVIQTTAEHPFWLYNQRWTRAGDLKPGDRLLGHDGQWTPVDNLLDTGETQTVYTLRVAEFHTYFVGADAWGFSLWAHNLYTGKSTDLGDGVELRTYEIKSSKTGGTYFRKIAFDTRTGEADFGRFYLRDAKGNPVIETIPYTGSRKSDFALANTQQGRAKPDGFTWHHLDYDANTGMGRMVLVQTDVHGAVGHSGGVSTYVAATGINYRD